MTATPLYVFGRVGPFGLLMAARLVRHIRPFQADTAVAAGRNVYDLRNLFKTGAALTGSLVTLFAEDESEQVVIVDAVSKLHAIDDSLFLPLPAAFRYASNAFDAVCRRSIDGVHGLRLRRRPQFLAMPA